MATTPLDEEDQLTLRIFTLLFVNSFLIGAAVGIHHQRLWFPEEDSWVAISGLYMMAATFVQMIAFVIYKVFAQERLQDQQYIQTLTNQSRRNLKRMNADMQKFQLSLEMQSRKQQMESQMKQAQRHLADQYEEAGMDLSPE